MNGPQRHPAAAAGNTEQGVKDRCVHRLHVTLQGINQGGNSLVIKEFIYSLICFKFQFCVHYMKRTSQGPLRGMCTSSWEEPAGISKSSLCEKDRCQPPHILGKNTPHID